MKDLESQIKELKAQKKAIDAKLKPLEKQLKERKQKKEELGKLKEGFSEEMILNYKKMRNIPSSKEADYYSWSISGQVRPYFDKIVDSLYLNRYERYCFTDLMFEWLSSDTWNDILEEYGASMSEETFDAFNSEKLKTLEDLPETEQKGIRIMMKMIEGISSNEFKWDW